MARTSPSMWASTERAFEVPFTGDDTRLATLAEQLDILLARSSPDPDTLSTGLDDVGALWKYVIEVFEESSPLRTLLLKAVSRPVREVYMTIEESLLAKGKREGKREGVAKGLATAVLDLLELRAVPIPPRVRKRVLATRDESLLRRWLARTLTVPSAEALFEPLEA